MHSIDRNSKRGLLIKYVIRGDACKACATSIKCEEHVPHGIRPSTHRCQQEDCEAHKKKQRGRYEIWVESPLVMPILGCILVREFGFPGLGLDRRIRKDA